MSAQTSITSKLNSFINYPKQTKIYKNDQNKEVSVYKINLTQDKIPVIIALGEIRREHSKHNIAYCSVYLVLGDEIHNKIEFKSIGIYEFFAAAEENLKDKEGDLDLHLIEGPLLYPNIKSKTLKQLLNDKPLLKDISEREEEDARGESDEEDPGLITVLDEQLDNMKKMTGKKIAVSAKPVIVSLVQEDDDDTFIKDTYDSVSYGKIANEYEKMGSLAKKDNWLQIKFNDYKYKLVPNRGAGDCFFIALKQAFKGISIKTTEKKLREKLAANFSADAFNQYKTMQTMLDASLKQNQKEQESVSLKFKALQKLIRDKQKLFEQVKKSIGQKSIASDPRYKEIKQMKTKLKEIENHFRGLQKEFEDSTENLTAFNFMTNINTLEQFKNTVKSSDYWADDATLRIMEEVLNIKIIVIDKARRSGHIHCTDASDTIKAKGWFKPKYYVLMDLDQGKIQQPHYQLVEYGNRKIFRYHELPYSIKEQIKLSCLIGSAAGIYNYIPKFNQLIKNTEEEEDDDDKEHQVAIQDSKAEETDNEKLTDYDKNVVFIFWNKAPNKKPGKGENEDIPTEREDDFKELAKEKDWRKVLSNSWRVVTPFELDGHTWNSVDHYYQASKFKNHTEGSDKHKFYLTFTAEHKTSKISKDPAKAKSSGCSDKSCKYRAKHILMDEDFFNGKHKIAMESGQRAKYTTDLYSQKILLLTNNAKLVHMMKTSGKPSQMITFYDTMKIRKEINNK